MGKIQKRVFGLGRSSCPIPAPMAVCKPKRKMIIAPIAKKLGLRRDDDR